MRLPGSGNVDHGLRRRILVYGVAVGLGLFVLLGRIWYLQIQRGEEFSAKSSGNFIKEIRVPADRGMILDRRGVRLVDNRPSWDVYVTPAFCGDCEEVLGRLAAYLALDAEERMRLDEQVRKARGLQRFQPILVRLDLDRDQLDVIEANRDSLPGVDVVSTPHRDYLYGTLAAHMIGYLGEANAEELERFRKAGLSVMLGDYVGKTGVERRFEAQLRGRDGIQRVVTDARGQRIPGLEGLIPRSERFVPSVPGHNVVLSIDARLQEAVEEIFDVPAGAVVVMEVNTGYVLAIASRPTFDPNRMTGRISREELRAISEDPLRPMLFRPVQSHYPPGSIYKVIASLAAFEHGFAGEVHCGGGYTLGRRRWRCHKESGHGWVSPEEALQVSCDTWYYAAADRIGIDALADMARRFGLGAPTGLDLGWEVPGIVPSVDYYEKNVRGGYMRGYALNTVIGQGDNNVTPLQMAVVYAAIANGGTIYRPQVVRRIERPEGYVVQEFLPEVRGRIDVPKASLDRVRKGLEMVVETPGGTAYAHRILGRRTAGKTGTAQVVRIGSVRQKVEEMEFFTRDHAWFAAYGPAEEPEVAVVVLNEHGGSGSRAAAPYAMRILERYYQILEEDRAGPPSPEKIALPPRRAPRPAPVEEGAASG
ncbi:MAG: penicillin-binding protein 2 [Pseudomonadota bacterium]|nr:MAG: penicillin-binding protein 2 [Pseudomonadota bacterium]